MIQDKIKKAFEQIYAEDILKNNTKKAIYQKLM